MATAAVEMEPWCVVTGGRGFAARHLVEMLLRQETFRVRIVDLAPAIQLESHEESGVLGQALRSGWVQYVSADIRNEAQVAQACQGAEVVFHMATPDPTINNYQLHYSVNVQGTKNVIDACVELGVKRLIYTSSIGVVFDRVHGLSNANESMPYPAKHNDSYSATKAEGEALVMKSNGSNGLLTCCIRPSIIFGPGDRVLVPSLVASGRAGTTKFIIGDGNNLYDFTYVGNLAHALICAEQSLASIREVSEKAGGQAYFIGNMEPVKYWEFMSEILEGLGYERPRIKIPTVVLMPIAHLVELTHKLFSRCGMKSPKFTPSIVRFASCSTTFDCSKAKDHLGYMPVVSFQEAKRRTIDSFSHLRAENQPKRDRKAADTLLWNGKKQILVVIVILLAIYYNYVATGSTLNTVVSKLLLVALICLLIHGIVLKKMKM